MTKTPPRSRPAALLAASLLAFLLAAAPAGAATAKPLKRCFLSVAPGRTEPVPVAAAGFTPRAAVEVRVDGETQGAVAADGAGRVTGTLPAPYERRRQRSFVVELIERDKPSNAVRLRSRVTALSVKVRPRSARPHERVRWVGRGFIGRGAVYAHYALGDDERETVRLGRPRGACGRFSFRRRQFPFRPAIGSWVVQIDQQPEFSAMPDSPFVRLPITVRRVSGGR